jgi:hypothetical protein
LRADGTVTAWGNNGSGQTTVPAGLSNVVAVAAGSVHSLALKDDGTVVAWGAYGKMPSYTNAVAISAGYSQSTILQADGTLVNWTTTGGATWLPAGLTNLVASSSGGASDTMNSLAMRADGTLLAWGGDLGNPFMIPADLQSATAISAGGRGTLALLNDRSPAFTVQPWDRRVASGTNVTLRALAVGQPPVRFQWYCNGQLLPGATSNYLTLSNTQPSQSGAYQLVAFNDLGTTASGVANLTIAVPAVRLAVLGVTANGFRFSFTSLPRVLYIVEFKPNLAASVWTELERRFGIGDLEIVTDTSANGAARFYRVRALYAPPSP